MKVGLHLTNQHPVGSDLRQGLDGQIRLLHAARSAGWDSVWAAQHYLTEGTAMLQPVPYLARLIAEAGDLRIGLAIHLLALQNPVAAAEEIATLDILAGGRLVYGAGLGYRDVEYAAAGVRGSRVERFEKNLDIMQRLWAGEAVSVDLPWCRLQDAKLGVLPLQRPRPPVWLAANSDAAVERSARLGDAWIINPHAERDTVVRQLARFIQVREEHDLPPAVETPLIREVVCGPTREAAMRTAGQHLGRKYATYADWGQDRALPGKTSFRMPFEELARQRFLIGTPDDCIEELRAWLQLGVTTFIFRVHWPGMPLDDALGSLTLLARDVIPRLRASR